MHDQRRSRRISKWDGNRREGLRRAVLLIVSLAVVSSLGVAELRTSFLQAQLFSHFTRLMWSPMYRGPSPYPAVAPGGPYDERLGYDDLGQMIQRLRDSGYRIEGQARPSDRLPG